MKLETLYKRTKTGAIQYYQVETDMNIIIKTSGQLGTDKPIVHKESVLGKNLGKANETSPDEQAELQAQSDWRKKKDEGYKTLKEIHPGVIVGPTPDAGAHAWKIYDDIVRGILERDLPKFNTDANGNVKPMLATDWKKIKKIDYPVLVQPKLDGVRCLMVVSGSEDVVFLSRSGKTYNTLSHIAQDVKVYLNSQPDADLSFILDGEIYSDELTFQQIIEAVKKQRENSLKLHFRAYDVVDCLAMQEEPSSANQEDRIVAHLYNLVRAIDSPLVHHVEFHWADNESEVKTLHDEWVQKGYEGAMIRLPHAKYEQGCRSRSLLKVKEFDENEFNFVGWETGLREEDLLAECETGTVNGHKGFRAKMVGTREEKEKLRLTHPKKITIKHFGWTNDGLPRFPIGKAIRDYE